MTTDTPTAYRIAAVRRSVELDIVIEASAPAGGIEPVPEASYLCGRIHVVPGVSAEMSGIRCPKIMREALDGDYVQETDLGAPLVARTPTPHPTLVGG